MALSAPPRSCDTFVALPPVTANGHIIFGKNSDRPETEVQEVVMFPASNHPKGEKVKVPVWIIQFNQYFFSIWKIYLQQQQQQVCIIQYTL